MIDDRVARILADFADVEGRRALGASLAEHLGGRELMIFIRDEEVGVYLPAAGFPQTLQDGRHWHEFLGECDSAGRASETMVFPSGRLLPAHGAKVDAGAVIVLGGDALDLATLERTLPLLRLLARVLRGERAVASARGSAAAATQAASYAEEMARALDRTRRELQESLEAAEQARIDLHERDQHLSAIINNNPECVMLIAPDGCILNMNPAGLHMAEASEPGAVLGRSFFDFVAPEHRRAFVDFHERICAGQRDIFEYDLVGLTGTRRTVEAHAVPLTGPGGMTQHLSVTRDVTERRHAEAALRQAHAELEQKVADRTAELRYRADQLAKLTSELTLAEQRERRRLAQVLHDHLQQILVAARMSLDALAGRTGEAHRPAIDHVQHLLGEAIESSRSLTIELSPPILHDAGLTAGLQWLGRWFLEKHRLEVDVHAEPGAEVEREDIRILLFQAARELLFNVVKHAGVRQASVHLAPEKQGLVRLTVSDCGEGFDPAGVEHGSDASSGGFGLFSIRERLGLLGGAFEVQSAAGAGSRIVIVAPSGSSVSNLQAPAERAARETVPTILQEATAALKGAIRVLVVDDHEVVRQGLRTLLSNEPTLHVVGEACDGYEAIAEAERLQPDVVLMDFSMPHMNGIEATRRLRRSMPEVRIVALSMYDEPDRAQAMLDAGACAYVVKSGRSDALIQTLQTVGRMHLPDGHSAPEAGGLMDHNLRTTSAR